MVIWPQKVCRDDEGWRRTCALLQVLALDPRRAPPASSLRNKSRTYFESADDFLIRPNIFVDRKQVPASYYSYSLRFNVSISAHGVVPIADMEQCDEFRRAVNAALRSELTVAERKRWEADHGFRSCCAANDPMAEVFATRSRDESRKADHYYLQVREAIEASRRFDGIVRASLCQHEEIVDGLIRLGATSN